MLVTQDKGLFDPGLCTEQLSDYNSFQLRPRGEVFSRVWTIYLVSDVTLMVQIWLMMYIDR